MKLPFAVTGVWGNQSLLEAFGNLGLMALNIYCTPAHHIPNLQLRSPRQPVGLDAGSLQNRRCR